MARWFCAIFAGFLLPSLFLVFGDIAFNSTEFWGFISFGAAGMAAVRYLFMPDHRYCYSLTQAGLHYTDQEVIPDAAYTFVRGFAWVGIAVCLLALAVVGPLAFVGAGGFALLAFGLTNFRPTVDHENVYFADQLILFDPIKEKIVILETESVRDPRFGASIFFSSFDEKNRFIELVKSAHNNLDYLPLQRVKDKYKHPIFNQELKEE
ncbi:putative membrane protein [Vibrio cholerae]|nr:putative membrane protein [Vibrio cholerae]